MQENQNSFPSSCLGEFLQSSCSNDLRSESNVSSGCRLRQSAELVDPEMLWTVPRGTHVLVSSFESEVLSLDPQLVVLFRGVVEALGGEPYLEEVGHCRWVLGGLLSCAPSVSCLLGLLLSPHPSSLIPQHLQPSGCPAIPDQLPTDQLAAFHVQTTCVLVPTQVCSFSAPSAQYLQVPHPSHGSGVHTAASFPLFPFLKEIGKPGSSPGSDGRCPLLATVQLKLGHGETHRRVLLSHKAVALLCAAVRAPSTSGALTQTRLQGAPLPELAADHLFLRAGMIQLPHSPSPDSVRAFGMGTAGECPTLDNCSANRTLRPAR